MYQGPNRVVRRGVGLADVCGRTPFRYLVLDVMGLGNTIPPFWETYGAISIYTVRIIT